MEEEQTETKRKNFFEELADEIDAIW